MFEIWVLETFVVETGFLIVSFRLRPPPQETEGVSHFHVSSVYKFLLLHSIFDLGHVYSASKICESLFLSIHFPRDPRLACLYPRESFSYFTDLQVTADMPKKSDKPEKSDILFGQTRILVKDLPLFYYARRKFEYDGRPLTREECNDLISYKMSPKKAVNDIQHDVYDIFDDDTHFITKSLEERAQEHEASYHLQVKDLLQLLLLNDEDFRERRAKLHGLSV